MIKRQRIIISAVVFCFVFRLFMSTYAEAGIKGAVDKGRSLPTIELKDVRLRGTAISGIFKPIAIIEHTSTNENCWYEIGDILCGGRIVDIQRGSIVLDIEGKLYLFGLPEGAIEGFGTVSLPGRETEDIDIGEKVGENTWKVKLGEAIELLTKTSQVMKEARIRPYFAVGKAAGIRIDRITDGSVIRKMGFVDGDIIKGVNGFGVMTPTRIFDAYRKYKNDRLIKVQLIRDEEPATLTYSIVK